MASDSERSKQVGNQSGQPALDPDGCDNLHVTRPTLMDLPAEIISHILAYMSPSSLVACAHAHTYLDSLVNNPTFLARYTRRTLGLSEVQDTDVGLDSLPTPRSSLMELWYLTLSVTLTPSAARCHHSLERLTPYHRICKLGSPCSDAAELIMPDGHTDDHTTPHRHTSETKTHHDTNEPTTHFDHISEPDTTQEHTPDPAKPQNHTLESIPRLLYLEYFSHALLTWLAQCLQLTPTRVASRIKQGGDIKDFFQEVSSLPTYVLQPLTRLAIACPGLLEWTSIASHLHLHSGRPMVLDNVEFLCHPSQSPTRSQYSLELIAGPTIQNPHLQAAMLFTCNTDQWTVWTGTVTYFPGTKLVNTWSLTHMVSSSRVSDIKHACGEAVDELFCNTRTDQENKQWQRRCFYPGICFLIHQQKRDAVVTSINSSASDLARMLEKTPHISLEYLPPTIVSNDWRQSFLRFLLSGRKQKHCTHAGLDNREHEKLHTHLPHSCSDQHKQDFQTSGSLDHVICSSCLNSNHTEFGRKSCYRNLLTSRAHVHTLCGDCSNPCEDTAGFQRFPDNWQLLSHDSDHLPVKCSDKWTMEHDGVDKDQQTPKSHIFSYLELEIKTHLNNMFRQHVLHFLHDPDTHPFLCPVCAKAWFPRVQSMSACAQQVTSLALIPYNTWPYHLLTQALHVLTDTLDHLAGLVSQS